MIIKPIVTFKGGFMTERFVFGGSSKKSEFGDKHYTYQITSYLIDLGHQVILVDTSFPDSIVSLPTQHGLGVNIGKRTTTFEKALNDVGYTIEDIDTIILTHNNLDHAGEISLFPNAEIIVSEKDLNNLQGTNRLKVNPVNLDEGSYKNFKGAYKIAEDVYFVQAYGHSHGHGILIAFDKDKDVYYMFSGDATVADEALIANEVLLVHEDLELAKVTLNNIRAFIKDYPTLYLSSHDPKALYYLENMTCFNL